MEYLKKYEEWCNGEIFDNETKQELLEIKEDENEVKDRFYKDLEFGTAGLRGIIGAGTNRMNKYTVTKATQGLANFIIKEKKRDHSLFSSPSIIGLIPFCLNICLPNSVFDIFLI